MCHQHAVCQLLTTQGTHYVYIYTMDDSGNCKQVQETERPPWCLEMSQAWTKLCGPIRNVYLVSAFSGHKSSKTVGLLERVSVFLN